MTLECSQPVCHAFCSVMPGLVPGIHAEPQSQSCEIWCGVTAWMAGTSPAMTALER
jgi:hypothetical protein